VRSDDGVIYLTKKLAPVMIPLAQNPPTKLKFFFILNYTTHLSLWGLNSSLAQFAAELWLAKVCPERANYAFSEKF